MLIAFLVCLLLLLALVVGCVSANAWARREYRKLREREESADQMADIRSMHLSQAEEGSARLLQRGYASHSLPESEYTYGSRFKREVDWYERQIRALRHSVRAARAEANAAHVARFAYEMARERAVMTRVSRKLRSFASGKSRVLPRVLPSVWDVLGYLFPSKLREQVYEPSRVELEHDLRTAMRTRVSWKRCAIVVVLIVRTVIVVAGTWRVGVAKKVLPKRLRDWWAA